MVPEIPSGLNAIMQDDRRHRLEAENWRLRAALKDIDALLQSRAARDSIRNIIHLAICGPTTHD